MFKRVLMECFRGLLRGNASPRLFPNLSGRGIFSITRPTFARVMFSFLIWGKSTQIPVLRLICGTSFSTSLSRGGSRVDARWSSTPTLGPPRPDWACPRCYAWSRDGQSSVMATGPGVSFSQILSC
jgi:hypothetical protein